MKKQLEKIVMLKIRLKNSASKYSFLLVIIAIVFFILMRLNTIDQIWSNRLLPPEPDDSFAYVAGIKSIGDTGQYLFDFKHIWSWNNNDHIIYLPWKTVLLFVHFFGDLNYFDVYQMNFYFGIILLPFILLYFLKIIETDKIFWFIAFIFLAFYNGTGEYHGFFWVVPSFFSVLATFLLVALIFDKSIYSTLSKKKLVLLQVFTTTWLIWSHPLGKFSFVSILLSYLLYVLFTRLLKASSSIKAALRHGAPFILVGAVVIFLLEILPYLLCVNPSRYYSFQGVFGQASILSSISLFQKLFLNSFTFISYGSVFLIIGFIAVFLTKKFSLLCIWLGFFSISVIAALFSPLGYRILIYLWSFTFILFAYGVFYLIKQILIGLKIIIAKRQNIDPHFFRKITSRMNPCRIKVFYSLVIVVALVVLSYSYPFVQENYGWTVRFANYQNQRMSSWEVNTSIVDYLNVHTQSGDLIIFSDSNAFLTVTTLGLRDREVAYSDWNWNTTYSFLHEKVNGSYLISTGFPEKSNIKNLTAALKDRLALNFIENYGILNVYLITVNEQKINDLFIYDKSRLDSIIDDAQSSFWFKTVNIKLTENNVEKVNGNNSLTISLSQNRSGQNDYIWHLFNSPSDWSNIAGFHFYWYGTGSNKNIEVLLFAPDASNKFTYTFNDSFFGWKNFMIPLTTFTKLGDASFNNISSIFFRFNLDSPYNQTFYLDDVAILLTLNNNENFINLTNISSQSVILSIIIFVAVIFLPGLVWGTYFFKIKEKYSLLALSIGLSFSTLTISTFILNVFLNLAINLHLSILIFISLIILPFVNPIIQIYKKQIRVKEKK